LNSADKVEGKITGKDKKSQKFVEIQDYHKYQRAKDIALKKEELERNEKKICTFKPVVNETKFVFKKEENKSIGKKGNKFDQLYRKGLAKNSVQKDRPNKENKEEKELLECTFKPTITKKIPTPTKKVFDKNVDKFNERMKAGRVERKIKESLNERGTAVYKIRKEIENENYCEENVEFEDNNEEAEENTPEKTITLEFEHEGTKYPIIFIHGDDPSIIAKTFCDTNKNIFKEHSQEIEAKIIPLIEAELNK